MKRFLFFLILFFSAVFLPWQIIAFFASIFTVYFLFPFEIILLGFSLDALTGIYAPAVFTLGFFAMAISSEIFKMVIERESYFGKGIMVLGEIMIFMIVYFVMR